MGIRAEIKCIIKDFASCTVGANEAINAIANVVQQPKAPKRPKQKEPPLEERVAQAFEQFATGEGLDVKVFEVRNGVTRRII